MVDVDPLVPQSDSPNGAEEDWPARASATIVEYVGTVRDKTTGPALAASRNVVYFVAIGLIALIALIVLIVLLVRILVSVTAYAPFVEAGETWLAYMILGGLFIIGGMLLWWKKEAR